MSTSDPTGVINAINSLTRSRLSTRVCDLMFHFLPLFGCRFDKEGIGRRGSLPLGTAGGSPLVPLRRRRRLLVGLLEFVHLQLIRRGCGGLGIARGRCLIENMDESCQPNPRSSSQTQATTDLRLDGHLLLLLRRLLLLLLLLLSVARARGRCRAL